MKRMGRMFAVLLVTVLLAGFAQPALASEAMLNTLQTLLTEFSKDKNVVELPISNMYVLCSKERSSGLMLDDMVVSIYDYKRDWTWDPYWAGEWTIHRIGEIYMLCSFWEQNRREISNMPIDLEKYEGLSQRNGGSMNIVGMESAYMHGDIQTAEGFGHWEAYPFVLIDSDDTIFENAAYLNFRIVIPVDDEADLIQDFMIASQDKVAKAYQRMLELNMDINDRDRDMMTAFVEYIDLVNQVGRARTQREPEQVDTSDYEILDYGDGTCAILDYSGKAKDLVIPGKINGLTVVCIGEESFEECESLESVIIPDSVTLIEEEAFYHCENLREIILPRGLQTICDRAFYWCEGLTSVEIPEGTQSMGTQAFDGCNNLVQINIPDSMTYMESSVFPIDSDSSLKTIRISKNHPAFEFVDGLLIDRASRELISYYGQAEEVIIPDGVKRIGAFAFSRCSSIEEVVIPESVQAIDGFAFAGCYNMQRITIPDSVTEVGEMVFRDCGMMDIQISDKNPAWIFENGCLIDRNERVLCSYHGTETDVVIPAGVERIGERAFASGTQITSVEIPRGVKSIGESAFLSQYDLASVTLPDTLQSIEDGVFAWCYELKSIKIPKSVTQIGSGVFDYCNELSEIRGVLGSAAEKVADEYDLKFVIVLR